MGSASSPVLANPLPSPTVTRTEAISALESQLASLKARLASLEAGAPAPAAVQTGTVTTAVTVTQSVQPLANPKSTLAPATALLISFPSPVVVDVGQGDNYPLTLPLFQPIYSTSGQLLAPANTLVSVRVKPYQNGAVLVADSIILNGQMIAITAQSSKLPGRTITRVSAQQMARQNSAVAGNLLTSFAGAAGANIATQQQLGFLGGGIGIQD